MEFIESIMDENYTLVWVDYRESFNENRDLLQQCLEKQGCEDLWSKVEDWYNDAEAQATEEIIKVLKKMCIRDRHSVGTACGVSFVFIHFNHYSHVCHHTTTDTARQACRDQREDSLCHQFRYGW